MTVSRCHIFVKYFLPIVYDIRFCFSAYNNEWLDAQSAVDDLLELELPPEPPKPEKVYRIY